jgi:hypothetical protein
MAWNNPQQNCHFLKLKVSILPYNMVSTSEILKRRQYSVSMAHSHCGRDCRVHDVPKEYLKKLQTLER